MKPFDLKKARDGAISTTKGSLKIDNLLYLPTLEDEFKLMGVIDGKLERWTVDGTHWSEDSTMDLALKDESCEAWVNVYRDTKTGVLEFGNKVYKNVTDAENSGKCNVNTYVCTTIITWSE